MAKEMYVGVSETFTPVEYIESSGTQYIDTGIDALDILQNFKLVEEAQYSTSSTRQQFGAVNYDRNNPSENLYLVPISIFENNFFVQMETGNGAIVTSADTNLHTFITDNINGKASVDSTEVSFAVSTTSTTHRNIFLFARNLNGTADLFCNKKVYSTKIYNGDILVRDFIPVLDDNDIPCLFDKVENKFYYNKGTGNFTAGSATGEPVSIGSKARKIVKAYVGVDGVYTPVEYIETSGSQYIDTGVLMKDTLKVEGEFYDVNSYGYWYGARRNVGGAFPGITATPADSDTTHRFTYGGIANSGDFIKVATQLNEWHTVSHSKTLYIDNNLVTTFNNSTFSEDSSLCIFALNETTNLYTGTNPVRMKWFKLYDNNVLIRDYIPVKDNNNVYCLFDLVENKPYYNRGTGDFTGGNITGANDIEVHNFSRQILKGYVGVASSYTPVEYIESTGTQYIDSGVTSGQVNKIVAEFYNTFGLLYNSSTYGGFCVGARVSASNSYFGYNSGVDAEMLGNGTSYVSFQRGVSTEKITLDYLKSSYSVIWGSDTHSGNLSVSITTPLNMYVFAGNNNNGTAACGTYKIMKMQFYDSNDELIRDFIPVLDENNVACLYDKVENKPYYNLGTGTFTSGSPTGEPVITIGIARQFYQLKISYIESYGGQIIDTGVTMNANTRIVHTMSCTNVNSLNLNDYSTSNRCRWGSNGDNYIYYGWGTSNYPSSITANIDDIYTFDLKQGSQKITNSSGTTILSSSNYSLQYPTVTLKINNNITGRRMRTYSCQIYDGNTLIRDFVPMLDSNNRPCLYDKVNGTYYYNQGDGEFIYG